MSQKATAFVFTNIGVRSKLLWTAEDFYKKS